MKYFEEINLGSKFDAKGFRQAETAMGKLGKSAGKLATGLGIAFSARAVGQFAKASAKAFMEDEKASTKLLQAVNNLGMGFEATRITNFISDLEKTASVADDFLRPAFQSLLSVTGSVAKSQEMLGLAIDISAGSGEDLSTVVSDLTNAYLGQTKGLTKYNTGMTKAELAAAGFSKIQDKLTTQFSGQNQKRLETYAGQLDTLNIAFGNMQETIGKGLMDSLSLLAGEGGIGGAASAMATFADFTSDAIYGLATLASIKTPTGKTSILGMIFGTLGDVAKYGPLGKLADIGAKAQEAKRLAQPIQKNKAGIPITIAQSDSDKLRARLEKEALARQKELLALQKKSSINDKNKLSLTKAAAIFDLNKIQIAAALKNTYDLQERTRLEALMAIENEDGALALKKIEELAALQKDADMQKLMGIKAIKDETLAALNDQLLTELHNIQASELAEAEKDDLRNIAFGKYNAALTAAGDLMEKSYYSERTQIQLTEIAKIAAASNSVNAQITLERLRMDVSLDVIGKIREAQSAADKERMQALIDYINLLKTLGGAGVGLAGASSDSIKTLIAASEAELDSLKVEQSAIDSINKTNDSMAALWTVYNSNKGTSSLAAFDAVANLKSDSYMSAVASMPSYGDSHLSSLAAQSSQTGGTVVNVTVNAGAVGSETYLANVVQQAIQDINRNGSSTSWAGAIS